jgi:hypothetical protein
VLVPDNGKLFAIASPKVYRPTLSQTYCAPQSRQRFRWTRARGPRPATNWRHCRTSLTDLPQICPNAAVVGYCLL